MGEEEILRQRVCHDLYRDVGARVRVGKGFSEHYGVVLDKAVFCHHHFFYLI